MSDTSVPKVGYETLKRRYADLEEENKELGEELRAAVETIRKADEEKNRSFVTRLGIDALMIGSFAALIHLVDCNYLKKESQDNVCYQQSARDFQINAAEKIELERRLNQCISDYNQCTIGNAALSRRPESCPEVTAPIPECPKYIPSLNKTGKGMVY